MLKVGDKAPDIRVHTDTGEDFRLSELKGKRVVLYRGAGQIQAEIRSAVHSAGR